MSDLTALREAVMRGDAEAGAAESRRALEAGADAEDVLDGLIEAMEAVGVKFSSGKIFVPQMLRAARAMQASVDAIRPAFQGKETRSKGTVVIGTVKGDLHDIGKNLVSMMLAGAGFEIADLGVDVPADRFVQKAQEVEADVVAMSALLATTMGAMGETVRSLKAAGVRGAVKVLVGGAPVTEAFAREIGADGYAADAGSAVVEAKRLLGLS